MADKNTCDTRQEQYVQEQYAAVARSGLNNDSDAVRSIASAFGYSTEELEALPAEANMGVSCGNPLATASVREGETVVDLGCGGGLDVFLAAKRVGPTGKAIGIDMTPEMLERARSGAAKLGLQNVEFHLAKIDQLPLRDNSVDCVISNCVINLVSDKAAVFREILRVLKPGGRVAVSDIALKQALPEMIKQSVEAYVGCISGAILIEEYRQQMLDAGFESVVVTDTGVDLNAYAMASTSSCCEPTKSSCCDTAPQGVTLHNGLAEVMRAFDANAFAASVQVHALKSPNAVNPQKSQTQLGLTQSALLRPTSVHIYDRAMCCSSGVCGPQVDPVLPRFASDLEWLKAQGIEVIRVNLAQNPAEFVKNTTVQQMLVDEGVECLPLIMVNERLVSRSEYPSRENLALWTNSTLKPTASLPVTSLPVTSLPVATGCCGGDSKCC